MAGGQYGLSFVVDLPVGTEDVTVAPDNFLFLGVPDDELLVTIVAEVELVEVAVLACTSSSFAESNLAESAYLAHYMGSVMSRDNINLVVAFVGHTELALRGEFAEKHLLRNRVDNRLFHDYSS